MSEELLMIAKTLTLLSHIADPDELKYFEPGILADAIYSAAQHIERVADSLDTERG